MYLHVATRKGLFTYRCTSSGASVSARHFLGENVSLTLADPRDGAWYAALDHGHFGAKVQRLNDQGATWQEIAVPTFPPQDREETTPDGKPFLWNLRRIWSMEAGGAAQPGRLWCGTIPGGLFVSNDRGDSWALVDGLWRHPDRTRWMGGGADLPGIHSICVDPRDPRCIRIAVSTGGVWRSDDDGASWRVTSTGMFAAYMPKEQQGDPIAQDPHLMVQCRGQPDRLWIQHHNGIFRSDNGGELWNHCPDVPPSGIGFGFAVAVHPQRGDQAWFVPAIKDEQRIPVSGKVVVTRTDTGGRSWTVCTRGLPQDDAYDLTYRHALDVADDGKTLAFGSTTGGLWLSHDGGDTWRELSAHLPPIHAVRFAGG